MLNTPMNHLSIALLLKRTPFCNGLERSRVRGNQQESAASIEAVQTTGSTLILRKSEKGEELFITEVVGTSQQQRDSVTEKMRRIYDQVEAVLGKVGFVPEMWFELISIYVISRRSMRRSIRPGQRILDVVYRLIFLYPASTAIQGNSNHGEDVVLNLLALRGFHVQEIVTSHQCKASDYGKLFSRGKIVTSKGHHRACISGTASIDEVGTLCVNESETLTP